jgi:mitochondrial translocator assembly and maintenance protein 41
MIDLVLSVSNSKEFHRKNIKRNPHHYSFLKHFGPDILSKITKIGKKKYKKSGGGIYYNPYIKFDNRIFKYGIIETDDLIEDLEKWNSLYVAGRLQKPVLIFEENEFINEYLDCNLTSSLRVALLLLPEYITKEELYITITSLSYTGDIRMGFAENPNKIENIVKPNIDNFEKLYARSIDELGLVYKDGFYQNFSNQAYFDLIPEKLFNTCFTVRNEKNRKDTIKRSLMKIVGSSSRKQTIKGFFTSGFSKSFQYLSQKVNKFKT